jgi:hypothetical protein
MYMAVILKQSSIQKEINEIYILEEANFPSY